MSGVGEFSRRGPGRPPKEAAMGALLDEGSSIMDYLKRLDDGSFRLASGIIPDPEFAQAITDRLKTLYAENRAAYDWLRSLPEDA